MYGYLRYTTIVPDLYLQDDDLTNLNINEASRHTSSTNGIIEAVNINIIYIS